MPRTQVPFSTVGRGSQSKLLSFTLFRQELLGASRNRGPGQKLRTNRLSAPPHPGTCISDALFVELNRYCLGSRRAFPSGRLGLIVRSSACSKGPPADVNIGPAVAMPGKATLRVMAPLHTPSCINGTKRAQTSTSTVLCSIMGPCCRRLAKNTRRHKDLTQGFLSAAAGRAPSEAESKGFDGGLFLFDNLEASRFRCSVSVFCSHINTGRHLLPPYLIIMSSHSTKVDQLTNFSPSFQS